MLWLHTGLAKLKKKIELFERQKSKLNKNAKKIGRLWVQIKTQSSESSLNKKASIAEYKKRIKGLVHINGAAILDNGDILINTFGGTGKQILERADKKLKHLQIVKDATERFQLAGKALRAIKKVVIKNLGIKTTNNSVKSLQESTLEKLKSAEIKKIFAERTGINFSDSTLYVVLRAAGKFKSLIIKAK